MDLFGLSFAVLLAAIIILAMREPLRRFFLQPEWDFFVSHRSTDNSVIIPIVDILRSKGFRVWIDSSEIDRIKSQYAFRFPISVGIQRSSYALLFTSEEYYRSDYCREEAVFFTKRFASQPQRIIEIRLSEDSARKILGIPSASISIGFDELGSFSNQHEQYAALANEIIFCTRAGREPAVDTSRLIATARDKTVLWKTRNDAVVMIGELADPIAVTDLVELMTDDKIHTSDVMEALIKIGDEHGLSAIAEALERDSLGSYNGYAKSVLIRVCRGFKFPQRIPKDIDLPPDRLTRTDISRSLAILKDVIWKSDGLDQTSKNELVQELSDAIDKCVW